MLYLANPCKILNVFVQDKCTCNLHIIQHRVSGFLSTKYRYLVYKNECTFGLTCLVVTSMLVMGAPLWSLMTRTVIPVVGLLTAISPSLPPDIIILPVNEEFQYLNKNTIININIKISEPSFSIQLKLDPLIPLHMIAIHEHRLQY